MSIVPFAWRDRPSLIEHILPAQKISAEAQKERKAGAGQTLTALESYWKGRKPLILVKACVLGALLPATDNPELDVDIFEKLMAIDDAAFLLRGFRPSCFDLVKRLLPIGVMAAEEAESLFEVRTRSTVGGKKIWLIKPFHVGDLNSFGSTLLQWNSSVSRSDRNKWELRWVQSFTYLERVSAAERPEELDQFDLFASVWSEVNTHLGTEANSVAELIEQLGILRYGKRPRVGDTFCGGGSIPFEAARVGCDVYASDLNPIACMLTWGAINIIGAPQESRTKIQRHQAEIAAQVDREITKLGIEHDRHGNRAKAYLYCLEVRCPQSGWLVPLAPSWVISKARNVVARLIPDYRERRFDIEIASNVSSEEMEMASNGTLINGDVTFSLDGETYSTKFKVIRGDIRQDEPIRTRGWTYWHHLFNARGLLTLSLYKTKVTATSAPCFLDTVNFSSKLCRWETSAKRVASDGSGKQTGGSSDNSKDVFSNQALNTLYDYSLRSSFMLNEEYGNRYRDRIIAPVSAQVQAIPASTVRESSDLWITDPPYADAIHYHEITEFFVSWLRKHTPTPFDQWVWDSRRPLAIKGIGEEFRREMTAAYSAMSCLMPDNGLQIVMFTHQDAGVWADMAGIVWGAGLQVTAAWYIATETTTELKKGGYVQGTVLLVLRKRLSHQSAYRDELVQEVRAEVAKQIETMTGLNQTAKGGGRSENLFEDQDLQMAGYAAALRVLTGYSRIDGQDMAAEALRPRPTEGTDLVKEIIDFAVQVANEHLVPEGIAARLWERLTGPERFYLRMLDIETGGAKKLDNYQNFAKAFRYGDYAATMGSMKANDARLKTALEFKRSEFEGDFGKSPLRAVLFALYELQRDVDIDEAISHLRDLVPAYLSRREDLMALASVIASKREAKAPAEAQAARILFSRIKNERLG